MTGYPPVGIEEIDAEHAAFAAVLRNLAAAVQDRDAPRAASMFGVLLVRAGGHFASEEAMMGDLGYPGRARHIAAHRAFLLETTHCHRELCETGFTAAVLSFIERAPHWFEEHVRSEDLALGHAVAAARAHP